MRVLRLTELFHQTRRVHAPPGSPDDLAVRHALGPFVNDRYPLPAPEDEVALRTPFETVWSRRIPGTRLLVTYSYLAPLIEIRTVRPAW